MSNWAPTPVPSVPPAKNQTLKRLIVLLCLLAFGLAIVLWAFGRRTYRNYGIASAAVDHFHQELNNSDYDAIYEEASDEFRRSGNRPDIVKFLQMVHEKMGNSGTRKASGFHVNWRNGRVTVDEVFNTEFALGQGQESFVWIVEQDHARLYGYHIDSPNLR